MLNYLITVTEGLTLTVILLGLLSAYLPATYGEKGAKRLLIGAAVGFVLAAVVAVLKNATKLIEIAGGTGMWNLRIFLLSFIALVVYCIADRRRKDAGELPAKTVTAVTVAGAVLAFTFVFYTFPDVLAYPFTFSLNGESLFSTAFFYRFIGYVVGLILCLLIFVATRETAARMSLTAMAWMVNILLFLNAFQQLTKIIQVLHAKRVVGGHFLFVLVRFTSNHSDLFIYLTMAVALAIPIFLWIKSFRVNEPYENPAEHRKIRAKWRRSRRWSTALICCFALVVVNLTALTSLDNREVELSPAEECEIRGDSIYLTLEQVGDGHLHRFAYTTENGVDVRFIVIKKPNASSYGLGLDACDICGETGYYERSGQIVCKLCDVVMNINTIGFKGGCNPIPIEYRVEGGYIIIPVATLIEHEAEFQ